MCRIRQPIEYEIKTEVRLVKFLHEKLSPISTFTPLKSNCASLINLYIMIFKYSFSFLPVVSRLNGSQIYLKNYDLCEYVEFGAIS